MKMFIFINLSFLISFMFFNYAHWKNSYKYHCAVEYQTEDSQFATQYYYTMFDISTQRGIEKFYKSVKDQTGVKSTVMIYSQKLKVFWVI